MKKLVLVVFVALIAITSNSQTIYKSLNGYNQVDALNMIKPFQVLGTQPPQVTSVWFDRRIINNMIILLNAEAKQKKADGIRVYFAYDDSKNETVVVVSTYNSGKLNPQSEEKDTYHVDYYDHLQSALLFNMQSSNGGVFPISGTPCHDNCGGGAILYSNTPGGDDGSCDSSDPHYLTKLQCETMVQYFAATRTYLNTTGEWFDIKMIKAFAKESSKIPNYDGIRIYFARHPDVISKPKYVRDKDSFVIVTTQSTADPNIHQDYFNCSETVGIYNYMKSSNHLKNSRHLKNRNHLKKPSAILKNGQDNGELCPTNCTS